MYVHMYTYIYIYIYIYTHNVSGGIAVIGVGAGGMPLTGLEEIGGRGAEADGTARRRPLCLGWLFGSWAH